MHACKRKKGRKEGGSGLWLSLGCGLHGHQCPKLIGAAPPQNNQTEVHELHQVVMHLTKSLSNIQSSNSLPYLSGTQKSLDSQIYTFQWHMSNKCLGERRWMRQTRDLQDNQLTNPKTQTPWKNKNKTRRMKENSNSKHIGMPNIWKRWRPSGGNSQP